MNFKKIEQSIRHSGWFYFGRKDNKRGEEETEVAHGEELDEGAI